MNVRFPEVSRNTPAYLVAAFRSSGQDIEQRSFALAALDFISQARDESDISRLVGAFLDLVVSVGISWVAMTDIWRAEPDLASSVRFTTFEAGWVADYIRDRWDRHDPIWHAAYHRHVTHRWASVLGQDLSEPGPAADRYRSAGIVDGMTVPILLPKKLRSGIFLAASRPLALDPVDESALTLAANVLGIRAAELLPATLPESQLTAREKEILVWTAMGKSAKQVAIVLDLSEQTVSRHLLNIRQKLQAANTVQAVARAILEGIITA